jgi:Recombination endonuclease VII
MPKGVYESATRGRHVRTPEQRDAAAERSRRHGMSRTPTHYAWVGMIQRCTNPKSKDYPLYGGKGVTVCEKWLTFDGFFADMGEKPAGTRLARINTSGNYEPDNCQWQKAPHRDAVTIKAARVRATVTDAERYAKRVREDPQYSRWTHIRHRYGLDRDGYAALLAAQDACCYLCGEPLDLDNLRTIHVDHDHSCCRGNRSCGHCIRGLACEPCNKGIGAFGDDPERMRRVADNLEMANRQARADSGGLVSPL